MNEALSALGTPLALTQSPHCHVYASALQKGRAVDFSPQRTSQSSAWWPPVLNPGEVLIFFKFYSR